MTPASEPADREPETVGPGGSMPVVTDPNFLRTFADQTLVMDLGRDTDIAFMAVGAMLRSVEGLGDDERESADVSARPQLNEVVRVRLSPSTAATLSMQIMQQMIARRRLNVADVIESINDWEASAAAGEASGGQ